MAGISVSGVGSGLDVNAIVTQLMALERKPLEALQSQASDYQTQLSAYGKLRSAVSSFESAMDGLGSLSKFKVFAAVSSDEDALSAVASSSAGPGSLSVQVVNLAVAKRMGSGSFASTDTIGATGDSMTLTVGSASFTVDIGGKTLAQIRDAVNEAADNAGVTATLLNESDSSQRLVLTSNETGTANAVNLSFENGGSPIADPLGMTETVAAEDAQLLVDNTYTITRSSNTIDDAVQGVTLTLKAETTSAVNLTVQRDNEAVKESVGAFVEAYNNLRSTIDALRKGGLSGDNTLLLMERRIQGILNTPPSGLTGGYSYLSQIGVSLQKDGTMAVDDAQLSTALSSNFNGVADLFADKGQGYAYRLGAAAGEFLASNGLIDSREDGINSRIDLVRNRQDALERRLEDIQKRYETQFSALDTLIGQLSSTGNYLTQQLSALQKSNG